MAPNPDPDPTPTPYPHQHCVNENYKEQISCSYNAVTSVMTNKAFGKHNIPYSQARLYILYILYTRLA